MRSGFAVRQFFPTLRFTQPVPAMLAVKRGAVTTQQFHLATTYSVIHGNLPVELIPDHTPADAEAALNRRDSFELALSLMQEATVWLTDVLRISAVVAGPKQKYRKQPHAK
jgi:hypothetical protein